MNYYFFDNIYVLFENFFYFQSFLLLPRIQFKHKSFILQNLEYTYIWKIVLSNIFNEFARFIYGKNDSSVPLYSCFIELNQMAKGKRFFNVLEYTNIAFIFHKHLEEKSINLVFFVNQEITYPKCLFFC